MSPKLPSARKPVQGGASSPYRNAAAATQVPRPVVAFARSDPAGQAIEPHRHLRDQFIYATSGVMRVTAAGSLWSIPPSHGIWMPAGVEHAVRMESAVEMRTIYFEPGVVHRVGAECSVLAVTPLLRELVIRAMTLPPYYERDDPSGRLMQVLADEVSRLPGEPLSLRLPADRRLAQLCEQLLNDVSSGAQIAEWGERVGLSERSVSRLFIAETGMSFGRWREQARLMKAFLLLEQGMSVTRVALDLGYSSGASFSKVFRRRFGAPPRGVAIQRLQRPRSMTINP